jgi:AhpD family alkylhydroperoxidase
MDQLESSARVALATGADRGTGAPLSSNNLHRAIANLPDVAGDQRNLIGAITRGLAARTTELAILRYAAISGNRYCWGHHVVLGRRAGIVEEEIEAVSSGRLGGFSGREQALLGFVDAASERTMDDGIWAEAERHFSSETLLRLVMLVGFYSMMTVAWSALNVPLDDGLL